MKAQPNEYGVTWSASKSGRVKIALGADGSLPGGQGAIEVWALYTGTHDLVGATRRFQGPKREQDARAYANELWRRY